MDFVESSKSQWSGRYSWGDENQSSNGLGGLGSKIVTNYEQYLGSNTRTLTPRVVNEARFGYTRIYNSTGTLSAGSNNVVGTLAIPGLKAGDPATWGIPAISLNGDGFSGIGDNTDGPYVIQDNSLQLVDNLSWTRGKHTFRAGFEFNRQNFNQVGNQFSRGNFVFQPNATQSATHTGGDAFAEFLLGDLYQSTVAVAIANAQYKRNTMAAFVDDTYRITPRLTLSLGLRYELTPPWVDQAGTTSRWRCRVCILARKRRGRSGPTSCARALAPIPTRDWRLTGPTPPASPARTPRHPLCAATARIPTP